MRIAIATPGRAAQNSGNDVTAARWSTRLGELGHTCDVVRVVDGATEFSAEIQQRFDRAELLVVLHARRCAGVARWWRARHTEAPLVVAITGTDLYVDMPEHAGAMATAAAADHLVVLQERAAVRIAELIPHAGSRTTVIHQSVDILLPQRTDTPGEFRVVVLAHLRPVKDPLMAARAARLLPGTSTVTVHHGGAAHSEDWNQAATEERLANRRYHWHEGLARPEALELLASGDVLACTSSFEGGANVVTEAIALGVPVVGTNIDGNIGLLGADYPGLVAVGDDQGLADLLLRLETSPEALRQLQDRIDALKPITQPGAETESWRQVLDALT